jgi:hypothetical protein
MDFDIIAVASGALHDLQNRTLITPNLRLVINLWAFIDQLTGSIHVFSDAISKIHCHSDTVIKYR